MQESEDELDSKTDLDYNKNFFSNEYDNKAFESPQKMTMSSLKEEIHLESIEVKNKRKKMAKDQLDMAKKIDHVHNYDQEGDSDDEDDDDYEEGDNENIPTGKFQQHVNQDNALSQEVKIKQQQALTQGMNNGRDGYGNQPGFNANQNMMNVGIPGNSNSAIIQNQLKQQLNGQTSSSTNSKYLINNNIANIMPPQSSVSQQNVKKKKVTVHELESRFSAAMDIVNSRKKFEYWAQNDQNISASPQQFISLEIDDESTPQIVDAITQATYTYAVSFNQNVGLQFDQRFIVLLQQIFTNNNIKKVIHDYTGMLELLNATMNHVYCWQNQVPNQKIGFFTQIINFHDISSTLEYSTDQKQYFVESTGFTRLTVDRMSLRYFNEQLVNKKPNWKTYESSNTINHIRRAFIYALAIIKIYDFQVSEEWNSDQCWKISYSNQNMQARYLCDCSFYKGYEALKNRGYKVSYVDNEPYKTIIAKVKKEGSVVLTSDIFFAKNFPWDNILMVVD